MRIAPSNVQAVIALFVSGVMSVPSFSQSTRFLNAEAHSLHRLRLASPDRPCSKDQNLPLAALPGDLPSPGTCEPSSSATATSLSGAPCNLLTQALISCSASSDIVRDDLNSMGKQGQIILRARDKVLEILQSENACTEWFRTKDPEPAATFRTLTFTLDRDGEAFIRRSLASAGIELIRNPYVASVLQGGGPHSSVTLNLNGAFFFSIANVLDDRLEGGPLSFRGSRPIQVGPYRGGSFRAQVVALLHEFGHVIGLLPQDHDDYEGRSRQNTQDVLHACRAEVESKEARHTILASR